MQPVQRTRDFEALRERLSRLSAVNLRINESMDFDEVLQGGDSHRSLTTACYGVMTLMDGEDMVEDFVTSGITKEDAEKLWLIPKGWASSTP